MVLYERINGPGLFAYGEESKNELADYISGFFRRACTEAAIDPTAVKTVLELGSGYGYVTRALLKTFTNATVQAVDIRDLLEETKNNPRVQFFQGLFVDILESGIIPPPDILIMKDMGTGHGFDEHNRGLLEKYGAHTIISEGDNGLLEWNLLFPHGFTVTVGPDQIVPGNYSLLGWKVIQKQEDTAHVSFR
jgi:hypothetical protein